MGIPPNVLLGRKPSVIDASRPLRLSGQPQPAGQRPPMPPIVGGEFNHTAGLCPAARLAFQRARSQHGQALSALSGREYENTRNFPASGVYGYTVRRGFTEGPANGHVVTKAAGRSVFHWQVKEVPRVPSSALTAGVPVCLRQPASINELRKMRSLFALCCRATLSAQARKPRFD